MNATRITYPLSPSVALSLVLLFRFFALLLYLCLSLACTSHPPLVLVCGSPKYIRRITWVFAYIIPVYPNRRQGQIPF